jgi:hypothetical protein
LDEPASRMGPHGVGGWHGVGMGLGLAHVAAGRLGLALAWG